MQRTKHTIDAQNKSLGRVASDAAQLLMGKHKPTFESHTDTGDSVEITGYKNIVFTGANKMTQKKYYKPTTQPGHLKSETLEHLWERDPQEVVRKAVYGMLPKNSLRKEMIKRLSFKK